MKKRKRGERRAALSPKGEFSEDSSGLERKKGVERKGEIGGEGGRRAYSRSWIKA